MAMCDDIFGVTDNTDLSSVRLDAGAAEAALLAAGVLVPVGSAELSMVAIADVRERYENKSRDELYAVIAAAEAASADLEIQRHSPTIQID